MKMRALIVLFLSFSLCSPAWATQADDISSLQDTYLWTEEYISEFETSEVVEDPELLQEIDEIRQTLSSLDLDVYGGYYIGKNRLYTHINVVENMKSYVPIFDNLYVVYHTVQYTYNALEDIHQMLIPHMNNLDIHLLGVDVVLNKVTIGVDRLEENFYEDIQEIRK